MIAKCPVSHIPFGPLKGSCPTTPQFLLLLSILALTLPACSHLSVRSTVDPALDPSLNAVTFVADEDLAASLDIPVVLKAAEQELKSRAWAGRAVRGDRAESAKARPDEPQSNASAFVLHLSLSLERLVSVTEYKHYEVDDRFDLTGGVYEAVLVDPKDGREVWKCIVNAEPTKRGVKERSIVKAVFDRLDKDRTSQSD